MEEKTKTFAVAVGEHKYGKVVDNALFFRQYVGSGDVVVDGQTVQFELSIGANTAAPMVALGNRIFLLDWEDIIALAEQAELFKDEVQL
ncbi:MAG: hypothetical protein J1G38_04490 [Clostridiales bacterium]|nr:hypothetical protein [Clostridiales bacterium]